MRILGIDPGSRVTGYGIVEKGPGILTSPRYGEIKISGGAALEICLPRVYDTLMDVVRREKPDALAVEDIFYGKNVKSLIKQGHVRGVALLVGCHSGLPIYHYSPLEVKQAVVGYGRAEKIQVQKMVQAILTLPDLPSADASDALAVGICHLNTLRGSRT